MKMKFDNIDSNCAEKGRLRRACEKARNAVEIGWKRFTLGIAGVALSSLVAFGCSPAGETIYKDVTDQKQDSSESTQTQDARQKADVASPETHTKDTGSPDVTEPEINSDIQYDLQYVDVVPETKVEITTVEIAADVFPETTIDTTSDITDVVPDATEIEIQADASDVQQEIIEPPTPIFSYTFASLIGDYIDRTLEDRGSQQSEYPTGTDDTSDAANPFTDGNNGFLIGAPNTTALYRISGTGFEPLATTDVWDNYQLNPYTQTQNIWVSGNVHYSNDEDDMLAEFGTVAYTIKFDGPGNKKFGIPICTTILPGTDYTACEDNYKTEGHKINITLFGEIWTILHLNAPVTEAPTETQLVNGGSLELGKQLTAGILNLNETLVVGEYMLKLEDVMLFDGKLKAKIGIYDKDGSIPMPNNVVLLSAGNTIGIMVNGYEFTMHCWKAVNGGTENTTWADLSVFSETMKLNDGMINEGTDYLAVLGWKNRGASETDTEPDHLRTIILYSDAANVSSSYSAALKKGDNIWFPNSIKTSWKITYEGIDLTPEDYDTLKFQVLDAGTTLKGINGNANAECTLKTPYVKITSNMTGAFSGNTQGYDNEVYVATSGVDASCSTAPHPVFGKSITGGYEMTTYFSEQEGNSIFIAYAAITGVDNSYKPILIFHPWSPNMHFGFMMDESADTWSCLNANDTFNFGFNANNEFTFASGPDSIQYYPTSESGNKAFTSVYTTGPKGEGFISERGSVFQSASPYEVVFKPAKKLGKAKFTLATTEEIDE